MEFKTATTIQFKVFNSLQEERRVFQLVKVSQQAPASAQFASSNEGGQHLLQEEAMLAPCSFSSLLDKLMNVFCFEKSTFGQDCTICYQDIDGDKVTMSTDRELKVAVADAEERCTKEQRAIVVVKLFIQPKQQSSINFQPDTEEPVKKSVKKRGRKLFEKQVEVPVELATEKPIKLQIEQSIELQIELDHDKQQYKPNFPVAMTLQHAQNGASEKEVLENELVTDLVNESYNLTAQQTTNEDKNNCELGYNWPAHITKLFLDGNNMLFLTHTLRALTLRQKSKGEKVLSIIAQQFHEKMNLKTTHLCFDQGKSSVRPLSNGFEVSSAKLLNYKIADDALVDMAKSQPHKGCCMFVTSDRELQQRLRALGVVIEKPKNWITFACKILSGTDDLNEFIGKLQ